MGDSVNIEPLATGSLRIWLSEEELNKWELDKEETIRRPAVRRLVRQAYRRLNRRAPQRLLAELIPVEGGGVLLVSPVTYPHPGSPAVYHIADGDALLDLLSQWRGSADEVSVPHCCLYEQGEGYDLAVYPLQPLSARQQHLLAEYGTLLGSGEGVAAHCAEYGTLLGAGTLLTAPAPPPPKPEALPH